MPHNDMKQSLSIRVKIDAYLIIYGTLRSKNHM